MNNGYIGVNKSDSRGGMSSMEHVYNKRIYQDYLSIDSADGISDLVGWFEPSGLGDDGSGNVDSWADTKGNFTVTAWSSNTVEPTFHSAKINGYDAVKWENTGTDKSLLQSSLTTKTVWDPDSEWFLDRGSCTLFAVSAFEKVDGDTDTTPGNNYGSTISLAQWNQGMNLGDLGYLTESTGISRGYYSNYQPSGYWYSNKATIPLNWKVTVYSFSANPHNLEEAAPNGAYTDTAAVESYNASKRSRLDIRENGRVSPTPEMLYFMNSKRFRGGKRYEGGGVSSPTNITWHQTHGDMRNKAVTVIHANDGVLGFGYGLHTNYRSPGYSVECGIYKKALSYGECVALVEHLSEKYNIPLDP